MTMVQMNVRIDAKLKNEVEEVLKGKGVSVSDVIRSLWLYIADRKEVPALETTAEEQAREAEKQRKLKLIREGAGYVHKELVKAGLISEDTDLMEGLTYKQFRLLSLQQSARITDLECVAKLILLRPKGLMNSINCA